MSLKQAQHIFVTWLAAAALALFSGAALAQGDGARAYQLVPEGASSVSQFYIGLSGDQTPVEGQVIEGADIRIDIGATQFAQAFDIHGHQAGLLGILPYGKVSGSLTTGGGTVSGSDEGLGDAALGFVYGITGAPVLSLQEYVQYDPGFSMAALALLTMPTGSYDSDRSLNMGGNRWALTMGLPMMYYVGSSFLDPTLTSFELLPKVVLFSDNTDAPGATGTLAQDPLFTVEGHITRNFGNTFWGSLDALWEYGGETISDGVADGNGQNRLSLGLTGAMNFSVHDTSMTLKVTYGQVVLGGSSTSDQHMIRAQLLALF